MPKKYYAVRKGHTTGIFLTWDACKKAVDGYKGAEFKSFLTKEEAEQFINPSNSLQAAETFQQKEGELIAYVDGSFDLSLGRYSFGCVLLLPDGTIIKKYGNGSEKESLAIRNVAGEMLGAMYATKWAILHNYHSVNIRYDYAGIEKWVTGDWKAKNDLTMKYSAAMNQWREKITITFTKIAAHTGNQYNEEADKLAKEGLTKGNGIPSFE